MKGNKDLLFQLLRRMREQGILDELILIGSWCQYFYRIHFDHPLGIPAVRTVDVDFLIPRPRQIKRDINVAELLIGLNFVAISDPISGLVKFDHPELSVEFLVPERGRGGLGPCNISKLHVNAQRLRFLNMLCDYLLTIHYEGLKVRVPEPAVYVLHKLIVGKRRTRADKARKDLAAARDLGEFLLQAPDQRRKLKTIYSSLPGKWREKIKTSAKDLSSELYEFLD